MNSQYLIRTMLFLSLEAISWWSAEKLLAQEMQVSPAREIAPRVLFIGNSYTFGAGTPVKSYRPQTVTDLDGLRRIESAVIRATRRFL